MAALERGWIPRGSLRSNMDIDNACRREDSNDYSCILKKNQLESAVKDAIGYIFYVENRTDADRSILNHTGTKFFDEASAMISDYFDKNRKAGATCDFGGIAQLVETGRNVTGGKTYYYSDDEYLHEPDSQLPIWILVIGAVAMAFFGAMIGFVAAMRYSPGFNERVRSYDVFNPITKSSSSMIRSSLNLPTMDGYDPVANHHEAVKDGNTF